MSRIKEVVKLKTDEERIAWWQSLTDDEREEIATILAIRVAYWADANTLSVNAVMIVELYDT